MKHDGLLSLTDLSQPDDFPSPPHNGPSLTEMSSPLPIEPSDIKLDPAAADTSASTGERSGITEISATPQLLCSVRNEQVITEPESQTIVKRFCKL